MKIWEFKKYGVGENYLQIYVDKGYIVINHDNANIVSNDFAIRLFLSVVDKDMGFARKIAKDVGLRYASHYLNMIVSLLDGSVLDAKKYLELLKKRDVNSVNENEIKIFDFILGGSDTDFLLPLEDNQYFSSIMSLVKKYIIMRQYKIASDMLDKVLAYEKDKMILILKNTLDMTLSNTKYMADDNYNIHDDITYQGMASLERKLIIAYEYRDIQLFNEILDKFSLLSFDKRFVRNIQGLIKMLDLLDNNYSFILRHSVERIYGNIDASLDSGIKRHELYDIYDDIKESLQYKGFNTKYYLYKLILDDIMRVNKKNLKNFVVSGTFFNDAEETLDKYTELVSKGDKDSAKEILREYPSPLNNYDYLVKEVMVIDSNRENQAKIDSICEEADKMHDKNKAIKSYETALMLQTKKDPILLIKIASLYEEMGNFGEALHVLLEAEEEFLYPDTCVKMMELFIRCERYDKVFAYHEKYERYYPGVSSYDYYLLSIAYMNMGLYKDALECLDMVENINSEINGILHSFDYERNILTSLKNGEEVSFFTIDDYISLEIDDVDAEIAASLDTYLMSNSGSIEDFVLESLKECRNERDTLLYILNIIKILVLSPESNIYKKNVKSLTDMVKNSNVDKDLKKDLLGKVRIYKSVVKL